MASPARVTVAREGPLLVIGFAGAWSLHATFPPTVEATRALDASPRPDRLRLEDQGIESWDSSLLVVARRLETAAADRGIDVLAPALPAGACQLLEVARGTTPVPGA